MNDISPSVTEAIGRLKQSAGARQSGAMKADVNLIAAELKRLAALPMCQYDCDGCRGDDEDNSW